MGGALTVPRGAAPRCPAYPAGVPISPEKWGERGPGASPLDPQFYGPLAAARSFWRSCRIVPVMGLFRCPSSYPDLGTFFHKMLFQHIFPRKCVPNRFWNTGGNSRTTVPEPTIPKTSEWERAAIKAGSRGLPLVFFPPTFFKESRAPPPESAGPPGRCAPRWLRRHPPRGYAAPGCPW